MGLQAIPTRRQELHAEITILEDRQARRREYQKQIQAVIDLRQVTIDNLKAQLEALDG